MVKALEAYISFFESLSPGSVSQLKQLATSEMHFRDPFNDVHGRDLVEQILLEMFETSANPVFKVQRSYFGDSEASLLWNFSCVLKRPRGTAVEIEGMSRIVFDRNDKIIAHLDYWDAATYFYERVPLLGGCIRLIKRRLAVRKSS